jgi:hypothetical protein
LSSFLAGLHALCDEPSDPHVQAEIHAWVTAFERAVDEPLCTLAQPLLSAWYSGFWDFTEADYAIYRQRYPDDPLTEEAFKQTIQSLDKRWGDIDALLSTTTKLVTGLTDAQLEETWWYHPVWTVWELLALSQTLTLAQSRHTTRVRIQLT